MRAQHQWITFDRQPENYVVNTWHFRLTADPPDAASMVLVEAALKAFYQTYLPHTIGDVMSKDAIIKWYNLADPRPRVPVRQTSYTMTGTQSGTGTSLPAECSVCVSFAGVVGSGEIAARRRGRLFLPTVATTNATLQGLMTSTMQGDAKTAAATLLAASDAAAGWEWCGYSVTDGAPFSVVRGWVDNAFDTQRRRGWKPTVRSVFP